LFAPLMQTLYFITHEAQKQGKRVYRVDIDFKNTFNAMSQAALWKVIEFFKIPDADRRTDWKKYTTQ